MAIAIGNKDEWYSYSDRTESFTVSSNANRLLVVGCFGSVGETSLGINKVQYNGVSLSTLASNSNTSDGAFRIHTRIYYMKNPPSGAHNIFIDTTNSNYPKGSIWFELNGVDQTTTFGSVDATNTNNNANHTNDVSSDTDELVIDLVGNNYQGYSAPTQGAGQTLIHNGYGDRGGYYTNGGMSYEAGAASVTMSWTGFGATTDWATIAVPVKPHLVTDNISTLNGASWSNIASVSTATVANINKISTVDKEV